MVIRRGDVVLCRVPLPSTGLTEFKLRPAVVVSKDYNNERLEDITVAICTSNVSRGRKEPTQYVIDGDEIKRSGVKVPSVVKCESLMTINKSMVVRVIGSISHRGKTEIDICLMNALGIVLHQ